MWESMILSVYSKVRGMFHSSEQWQLLDKNKKQVCGQNSRDRINHLQLSITNSVKTLGSVKVLLLVAKANITIIILHTSSWGLIETC